MKLFADHCFFSCGIDLLRKAGYDIIKASDVGLQKADDEEIVLFCRKESRLIVTLDTDFSSLYRFPLGTHKGIVLFRINPFMPITLLKVLRPFIERKMFSLFKDSLVIVRRDKITIIRPSGITEII